MYRISRRVVLNYIRKATAAECTRITNLCYRGARQIKSPPRRVQRPGERLEGKQPLSKSKFTRVPKVTTLVAAGVPLHAVPTYLALADHADNKTGSTFVSVARVAEVLKVCRRTVERHIKALEDAGVIKRQRQRRAKRGRFSSCLRILVSFAGFTVRQRRGDRGRPSDSSLTKHALSPPKSPLDHEADRARRWAGYEWLLE
jgi:DNA-binding transcriptional ArsR family regulator